MPLCRDNRDDISKGNQLADVTQHSTGEQMNLLNNKTPVEGGYGQSAQDHELMLHNLTLTNDSSVTEDADDKRWLTLNELQMIKVIVLVVVIGILLISTCKVVFKTFSRYSEKKPEQT